MKKIIIPGLILLLGTVFTVSGKQKSRGEIFESASSVLIKNSEGTRRSAAKDRDLKILDENRSFTVVGFAGGS